MAKEEKNGSKGVAPAASANGESMIPTAGSATRLGKRRSQWKPGVKALRGALYGISGQRFRDGTVKETLVIKVNPKFPTRVSAWDATSKTASERESQPGEEVFVYLSAGLESLRGYASDPMSVYEVYIPKGEKIKIQGGKTFWTYVKDDPSDLDTLQLTGSKWKRTAEMKVEQVVGKSSASPDDDDAPAPAAHTDPAAEAEDHGGPIPF